MNNAAAAFYTYLAAKDRETARVFRACGRYLASAAHLEARAKRYEREAHFHAKGGEPCDPPPSASPSLPHDSDLHTTSDVDDQSDLFGS